jgi:prolyl-tRNA editing enzyme YbaK/EbsC (Cys-tRNA(Pro) deacylase)
LAHALDRLVVVELRTRHARQLAIRLPDGQAWHGPTAARIADTASVSVDEPRLCGHGVRWCRYRRAMEPLTADDVRRVLTPLGIEIRRFAESTATSQQAADAIGCELGQIVKSLCFVAGDRAVLVLGAGDQRIDDRKLAQLMGVARRQVRIATADECVAIVGYAPGGVPPIAHRSQVPIYIDTTLQRFELVYAAGGAHDAIFPIRLAQLIELTGGSLADVAR